MPHQIVKPQKLAATAIGLLEQELVIPNLFLKEGIDNFKGVENDTVQVKVPGTLPFHDYAWRNNRATPIVLDDYTERKISVSFGGNVYSAVKVTDEQNDFDLKSWADLLDPQAKAVGRGLQRRAINTLTGQTYNYVIGNVSKPGGPVAFRSALIEARRILNALRVPTEQRFLVVGSNFEAGMLNDPNMNLAQNVGDAEAVKALTTATIGQRFGFTIITDPTIGADDAYAFVRSAFVFLSGAPSVPQSLAFGSTTSYEGIALRWVRDYDPGYMQERSVVNTYAGFRAVTDPLITWDNVAGQEKISTSEYFVRGVKLTLDGASNYPAAGSELALATGISDAAVWTPTGMFAEVNAANA